MISKIDCDFVIRLNANCERTIFSCTLFSDEATFTNVGYVNRHNSHYRSEANPHWYDVILHKRLWPVNVWCGYYEWIIDPHFLNGTLTGAVYNEFL